MKRVVREGRIELQKLGAVERVEPPDGLIPYVVRIDGLEAAPVSEYLRSLTLSDVRPLTVRNRTNRKGQRRCRQVKTIPPDRRILV